MSAKDFQACDIEIGKTYWIKNKHGQVLSRTVLAIDSPQKGWLLVRREQENDEIDAPIHVFRRVYRLMGTDLDEIQGLGTNAQLC